MSPTHKLGTFEDFESTLKPFLPKTGVSKFIADVKRIADPVAEEQNIMQKLFGVPSNAEQIKRAQAKTQKDKQEVQDKILPLALRAPVLQKILDEPEALNVLSIEEIMNMAPMLGITRGDMFEALGPTFDKDNVLGFIKNALTSMAFPAMERDEAKFSAIVDKSFTNFEAAMPAEPPEGFMTGPFAGLTEQGQKNIYITAQGVARFADGFFHSTKCNAYGSSWTYG